MNPGMKNAPQGGLRGVGLGGFGLAAAFDDDVVDEGGGGAAGTVTVGGVDGLRDGAERVDRGEFVRGGAGAVVDEDDAARGGTVVGRDDGGDAEAAAERVEGDGADGRNRAAELGGDGDEVPRGEGADCAEGGELDADRRGGAGDVGGDGVFIRREGQDFRAVGDGDLGEEGKTFGFGGPGPGTDEGKSRNKCEDLVFPEGPSRARCSRSGRLGESDNFVTMGLAGRGGTRPSRRWGYGSWPPRSSCCWKTGILLVFVAALLPVGRPAYDGSLAGFQAVAGAPIGAAIRN